MDDEDDLVSALTDISLTPPQPGESAWEMAPRAILPSFVTQALAYDNGVATITMTAVPLGEGRRVVPPT